MFHAAADLLIAASGREKLWSLKKRSKVLSFFNGNHPGDETYMYIYVYTYVYNYTYICAYIYIAGGRKLHCGV